MSGSPPARNVLAARLDNAGAVGLPGWEATPRPVPYRSIAVFQALALGDLLCLTPALRALRERFPQAEIVFIGSPWAESLVLRLGSVDRFLPFPGYPGIAESPADASGRDRFLADARREPFDLALQMHGSGAISNGFVAALGARCAVGYRSGADDRLGLTLPWIEEEPEPLRWLRLVAAAGADGSPRRTEFPLTDDDRRAADKLLADFSSGPGPVVGLHVGAKDPARRWPPERFAALANALVAERGARIVLTGAAAEAKLTADVRGQLPTPALDLAGRTDLGAFAAVVAALDLLVTNDTGASHIAAAVRTPSVVLFGPTQPARWAPLDRVRHRVLDARDYVPGIGPAAALAALSADVVTVAALAQLDRHGARTAKQTQTKETPTCAV